MAKKKGKFVFGTMEEFDALSCLSDCVKVIDMLMPGVGGIVVEDYELLNNAPAKAKKLLAERFLETEEGGTVEVVTPIDGHGDPLPNARSIRIPEGSIAGDVWGGFHKNFQSTGAGMEISTMAAAFLEHEAARRNKTAYKIKDISQPIATVLPGGKFEINKKNVFFFNWLDIE